MKKLIITTTAALLVIMPMMAAAEPYCKIRCGVLAGDRANPNDRIAIDFHRRAPKALLSYTGKEPTSETECKDLIAGWADRAKRACASPAKAKQL